MEQLRASNSSKVTVEYYDPSRIFHLVSDDLQQKLPLRNLHWKSSSRPLRSISSLHVELVSADRQSGSSNPGPEYAAPTKASSTNGDSGNALQTGTRPRQSAESKKERRHQIPGLRQTPYLKIYLLRCDDTETYKSVSRKLLRDWVRGHNPPTQSSASVNKVENHDAFEWLIIHVLPSSGEASNGVRNSGSLRGDSRGDRSSSTGRWSTLGSSTVLEKVRSDFNGTSKSTIDRVAQIQLGEGSGKSLPNSSNSSSDQHWSEEKNGWNDLISKLKYLILASFDRRVSQYEDDIKEKDSQRKLPGWNFNTFFVLKEGLARGFESVGLIEDALMGYHELSAALRSIVDEQTSNFSTQDQTGLFREFTDDLREEFRQAAAALQVDMGNHHKVASDPSIETQQRKNLSHDFGALILDTDRKPYRDLILANNISAYEFLCYVFARQVSLLLRLANAVSLHESSPNGHIGDIVPKKHDIYAKADRPGPNLVEENAENLLILSEICQQAVDFITSVTRTIRNDLRSSIEDLTRAHEGISNISETMRHKIIDNLVASWTFSATQCILRKTSTQYLSTQLEPLLRQFKSHSGRPENLRDDHVGTDRIVKRGDFPDRTSSLPSATSTFEESSSAINPPAITSLDALRLLPPRSSQTGAQELAAQRAELTGLARRALGDFGVRYGLWKGNWSDPDSTQPPEDEMDEISLEDTMKDAMKSIGESFKTSQSMGTSGIRNQALCSTLLSRNAFHANYEDLTASMLALHVIGDRQKSAEALTADIAAIRFHMGDYNGAVSYFHQLAPFYAKDEWSSLEMTMLNMYAQCLKNSNRNEDYIRVGLKIVAKYVRESQTALKIHSNDASKSLSLSDLISASMSLGEPIVVSIDKYFDEITIDPYPQHYSSHDGFQLQLRLRNRTLQAVEAQQIRVQISSLEEGHQTDLELAAEGTQVLKPGAAATILLGTKITISGWYALNEIILKSENILFTQDFSLLRGDPFVSGSRDSVSLDPVDNSKQTRILVWPSPRALEARVFLHNKIHLEQPRSIDIEVNSGWNHISKGRVLLRAGSAGLRIRTVDTLLASGNTILVDQSQPGSIGFGELSADASMTLRVPYDLESDLKEIIVKAEILYTTGQGDFTYACSPKISALLPLGVNVQDTFQQDALFSRFTINTANSIPLCISRCYIQDSLDFEVASPTLANEKLEVFSRQPFSLMTRIRVKQREGSSQTKKTLAQSRLLLMIEYHCLDQEIYETLQQCFSEALTASNLQDLSRALTPVLLAKSRSKLSNQELEMIGLRREITLNAILDNDWSMVLAGIKSERRYELENWIIDWQEKNAVIPIPESSKAVKSHHLIVPVDIPQMGVVHTVSLKLHQGHGKASSEHECVAVAQPIAAQLVIKHTRRWSAQTESKLNGHALNFCYEMQANPDTWLIGGRRKAHFSAREDEVLSFALLLIPQRTGRLLYPSVEITASLPSINTDSHGDQKASGMASHLCEMDYRSQGETLLVVPNLGSTTVSLDSGNSASGAWLVDSKARGQI